MGRYTETVAKKIVALTSAKCGQIDWQLVGFWHQKLEIFGFLDSVWEFRNSLEAEKLEHSLIVSRIHLFADQSTLPATQAPQPKTAKVV